MGVCVLAERFTTLEKRYRVFPKPLAPCPTVQENARREGLGYT